jgi:hypothetical protein
VQTQAVELQSLLILIRAGAVLERLVKHPLGELEVEFALNMKNLILYMTEYKSNLLILQI